MKHAEDKNYNSEQGTGPEVIETHLDTLAGDKNVVLQG